MQTETTETRVTRRTHVKGQHVTVITRDGDRYSGHITGWGRQLIVIAPTDGGEYGWKRESHPVPSVDRVIEA